jgi:O-antigen/teichoic acid export membrane protein
MKHLFCSSLIVVLITTISQIFLARFFDLSFIADLKAATMYGSWIAVATCCQLPAAFLYYSSQSGGTPEMKNLDRVTFTLLFMMMPIAAVLFFLLFPILHESSHLSSQGLVALSGVVSCHLLFFCSTPVYLAQNAQAKLLKLSILYPAAAPISLLVAYFFALSLDSYSVLFLSLSSGALLLSEWPKWFKMVIRPSPDLLRGSKGLFAYAGRIHLAIFFETLGERADKIVVGLMGVPSLFARYAVVCLENPLNGIFLSTYGVSVVKKFGGTSFTRDGFERFWREMISIISFVTFPMAIFLILNSDYIIKLFFGERFVEAAPVFAIYSALALIRYAPFQALLRMAGLTQYNVFISFAYFLVCFCSAWLMKAGDFAPYFLGFGYLAGWLVFNGLAVYFFVRATATPVNLILGIRETVPALLISLIACGAAQLVAPADFLTQLILSVFLYLGIFFAIDRRRVQLVWSHFREGR